MLIVNNLYMISKLTERKVAHLFYSVGVREQEIDKFRESLCQSIDFEIYTAFRFLDSEVRGSLSATDFEIFLRKNKRIYDYGYLQLFIAQYDGNLDGRLSINEFSRFVLPATNDLLRDTVALRTPYTTLTVEMQANLLQLLELELNYHEEIEKLRFEINLLADFGLLDSFRALDINRMNAIDKLSIRGLISRNGYYLSESEISAILRRVDTDGDGHINYIEYVDAVMPKKARGSSPMRKHYNQANALEQSGRFDSSSKSLYGSRPLSPTRNSSPLRRSSPSRLSPQRVLSSQDSPLKSRIFKQESPSRFTKTSVNDSTIFPRSSSPLRKSSPLRASPTRTYITNTMPSENYFKTFRHSPIKNTNIIEYKDKRKSSPLRFSPTRVSPTRDLEEIIERYSPTKNIRFTPAKDLNLSPSSPLRRTSSKKLYSPPRNNGEFSPQRSESPLKSMPLRNASLRAAVSRENHFNS